MDSAEQAAMALAPVAGQWAELLFSVGLLGASLLAASVLPLATTYAVCEIFGWERGLNQSMKEAPMFYGLYTTLLVVSAIFVLIPGLQLFALMWLSQIANAVLLPLVLVLMLRLANNRLIMKGHGNTRVSNAFTTFLVVLVSIATVALFLGAS